MTELVVHVDIGGTPVRAGTAYFTIGREHVSTTFVYDSDYLSNPLGFDLEPALPRQSGSLPKLLNSSDNVTKDGGDMAAVEALLEAGSGSLGGARPKASVQSDDGSLLIAKFPHRDDEWDVMAWEKWALDLAEASGIQTPTRRLTNVGARRVLLLRRFDRRVDASRVGYLSAMTLLNRQDGDEGDYLDIAEAIPEVGANVNQDLRELYRRIAFNVAIHDTDDHLRNHGFLRAPGGWRLSPAFDVNPNPELGRPRVTSIGGARLDPFSLGPGWDEERARVVLICAAPDSPADTPRLIATSYGRCPRLNPSTRSRPACVSASRKLLRK